MPSSWFNWLDGARCLSQPRLVGLPPLLTWNSASSGFVLPSRRAASLSKPGHEGRHAPRILPVGVTELGKRFPLLVLGQAHVHPDQNWKHRERQQRARRRARSSSSRGLSRAHDGKTALR